MLFTSEPSSIDYVTLSGVCKRTGANEDELAVFLLKELVDNGVDFHEINTPPSYNGVAEIYVEIKYNPNKNHIIIKIRNYNFGLKDICFTEKRINAIFRDLDVFHSSKRNLFKLSRGLQGDALKEVVCIPYALASKYYNSKDAWNEPLIIRNGFGQEFKIRVVVDKIQKRNYCSIATNKTRSKYDNFTEVEIHLPYDDRVIDLQQLKLVLIEHALLNTHISFRFNLVTSTTEKKYYRVTLPETQKLSIGKTNSKRLTSIYYYDLDSFENLIYSIEDTSLILYNVLKNHFREGISLKREDDLLMPISFLIKAAPSKQESKMKIRDIFLRLRNAMGPATMIDSSKVKKDLLPFNIKARQRALSQRIDQLGYSLHNSIKYRTKVGYYPNVDNNSDISKSTTAISFPYIVEVAVINTNNMPYNLLYCEGINASPKHYYSFLDGENLTWTTKSGIKKETHGVMSLLNEYGYSHHDGKLANQRCIIVLNLWCPKIEYTDYGKSSINLEPFADTIVNSMYRMCSDGNRQRADDSDSNKLEAKAIFKEYLIEERYKKVLTDPQLKNTDRWNTSTPVYRVRPILESLGLGDVGRKYLQGLVKTICDEIPELKVVNGKYVETGKRGVEREELGIYEATRAYIYFRGKIHDVSIDRLEAIKKIAAYILIIEKEGVAELLTHYADMNGFALCYTRGFLTDNAKKLCELAPKAGARVALTTDDDFSGWVMAGKVPDIPRIGISLDTLKTLQVPLDQVVEDLPKPKGSKGDVDYHANKHSTSSEKMYNQGLISQRDWELLIGGKYGRRIEIDNVLAYVGAERFWNDFILPSFKKLFTTSNYNFSLNKIEYVTLPNLGQLIELAEEKCKSVAEVKINEIDLKYKEFEGIIGDITDEEEEIERKILGAELDDNDIQEFESEINRLIKKYRKRFEVFLLLPKPDDKEVVDDAKNNDNEGMQ